MKHTHVCEKGDKLTPQADLVFNLTDVPESNEACGTWA